MVGERFGLNPDSIKYATTVQPNRGFLESRVFALGRDRYDGMVLQHTRNERRGESLRSGEIAGPAMDTLGYMKLHKAIFDHDLKWQGVWEVAFRVTSDRKLVQELARQVELRRSDYVTK